MKLAAIERRSAVEQVVEQISTVIKDRKLAAGERLPGEHQLVEQLNVSRPVLREALARLQSMGLVDIQRGRGTFVGDASSLANCVRLLQSAVTISPQELKSYVELRAAIEVQAVRTAAERATEEDIAKLRELLHQLEQLDVPHAQYLQIDFQFHRKIVEVAGNPLMQNLMEVIFEFVLMQMAQTTPTPRENKRGRKEHQQILHAIEAHDSDAAERAMRSHMQSIFQLLKKIE